jgi:hypothetical protein
MSRLYNGRAQVSGYVPPELKAEIVRLADERQTTTAALVSKGAEWIVRYLKSQPADPGVPPLPLRVESGSLPVRSDVESSGSLPVRSDVESSGSLPVRSDVESSGSLDVSLTRPARWLFERREARARPKRSKTTRKTTNRT